MNDEVTFTTQGTYATSEPKASDWECEMFGSGPQGIVWRPRKGCEPNWFWRWMQHLAFGNKWKKRT